MAVTQNSFTGNGTKTDYDFTFPYLKQSEIKASLDGIATTNIRHLTATKIQFVNNTTDNTPTAPAADVKIKIYRETDSDSLAATFYAGSAIKSEDLNDNFTQNLYATQEVAARYLSNLGGTMTGDINLGEDVVIKFEGASDNAHETTLTVTDPTADRTITLPNVTGTVVTTGDTGSITSTMIANETIVSGDIANGTILNVDINASAGIVGTKISPDFGSQNVSTTGTLAAGATTVTGNIVVSGTVDGRDVATDGTKLDGIEASATADQSNDEIRAAVEAASDSNVFTDADHTKLNGIEASATADQSNDEIKAAVGAASDSNIFTDALKTKLDGIETSATADQTASDIKTLLASSPLDASHLAANSVTTSEIADAELTTLAGMQTETASILAGSTALTATTDELNILDNKSFRASGDGALTTTSDTEIPSSKVVANHVAAQIGTVGGFTTIATEVAFPATASQPASGVIISISDAAGVVVNGSGVSTTGRTTDGTPATVTINSFPSSLNGETLASGVGLLVTSTGSSNTYTYHKLLAAESDVKQLSDDINDFNARYRVAGSAPGSNNDAGDMYFDTSANKMKVYNGTTSAWDDVASVGNFYINTLSSTGSGSDTIPGGSATFNGTAKKFGLSNAPTMAQQLIVSINGVIQKPNAGSSVPSEGFAIDGNNIIFSAAPASGSDYFIVTQGSSVSIGTPSDNTVATAKIQNQAVTTAKITDANVTTTKLADAAVTNVKITDDTIAEVKLDIHNAPSGTDKFLKYTSNGMEWAVPPVTDISGKANLSGATFTGDVVFDGETANKDITFDRSENWLKFNDETKAVFGTTANTTLFHNNTDLYIQNGVGDIRLEPKSGEPGLWLHRDGAVELYDGTAAGVAVKKLETTANGINVTGQINVNGSALSAAPEITATVDGSLSANDAVIVKSTGNIEKVTKTITLASPITHSSMRQISGNSGRYEHVLAYDKLTGYVACVVKQVVGSSNTGKITFHKLDDSSYQPTSQSNSTMYQISGSGFYNAKIAANGKGQFLIVYKDTGDQRIVCAAWSVSSTGVGTAGQAKYVSASGQGCSSCDVAYSPDDDLFVLVYREGSVTKSRTCSMTSGGNTTLNTVSSDLFSYYLNDGNRSLYYDEYSNKLIHAGWNSSYVRAISGTISGTNLSWNSAVNIAGNGSYQGEYFAFGGDPKTGLMLAAWRGASSQSDYGQALGFKVNGNGFTAGSETQHREADTIANGVGYNGATDQIVLGFGGAGTWSTKTVSINSSSLALTFGTAEELSAFSPQYSPLSVVYMEDQGRMMLSVSSAANYITNLISAYYGSSSTNMTTDNLIGFSSAAYSNGNTGTVKVTGNTSTHSGLTAGSKYYVQIDGTLATTADNPSVEAGIALSSTKLLIKG